MKPICRVWNKEKKEMFYDDSYKKKYCYCKVLFPHIMLPTNCKDSKDKEIYECDIVKWEKYIGTIKNGGVAFFNWFGNPFFLKISGLTDTDTNVINDFEKGEVLGNIWENPTLLEKNFWVDNKELLKDEFDTQSIINQFDDFSKAKKR